MSRLLASSLCGIFFLLTPVESTFASSDQGGISGWFAQRFGKWWAEDQKTEKVPPSDERLKTELAGIQREFLRISSAQDRLGSSFGLVARISPDRLEIIGPDGNGLSAKWQPVQDIPGLEALLRESGLERAASASRPATGPARSAQPALSASSAAAAQRSPSPVGGAGQLAVQFDIQPDRVARCEGSPEFRIFLEQIKALKDLLGAFEVTAANPAGLACAERVANRIRAVGLNATAVTGRLFSGGIVARSLVGGSKGAPAESSANVPAESTEMVQLEDGRFKLNSSARIWLQRRLFGANVVPHSPDGFAFRSFPFDARPQEFTIYAFDGQGRGARLEIPAFFPLRFGQGRINAFQLQSAETVVSRWDQVEYIKLSDANLAEMRAELMRRFEAEFFAYRLGVGVGPRVITMDASGLKAPVTGVHAVSATVRNRVLKRWILGFDMIAPLSFGVPSLTRAMGDLTYLIYGENTVRDQSARSPYRLGLSAGAYYYRAGEPAVADVDRGNNRYLSDFFGASLGGVAELYPTDRLGLRLSGGFTPIPPTQFNSFSVSWHAALEGDYCWSSRSCAVVQVARESYQIELKDSGLFSSELMMAGLFYRYAWK